MSPVFQLSLQSRREAGKREEEARQVHRVSAQCPLFSSVNGFAPTPPSWSPRAESMGPSMCRAQKSAWHRTCATNVSSCHRRHSPHFHHHQKPVKLCSGPHGVSTASRADITCVPWAPAAGATEVSPPIRVLSQSPQDCGTAAGRRPHPSLIKEAKSIRARISPRRTRVEATGTFL